MNTSSYSREPPSPKRATPQNASVGAKVSHPFANPQSGRETKLYHLPGPTVDELLKRLNGNAPPTKMIGRKAPGTNGFFLACDAVPWKSSAQREAERLETMRRRAEEGRRRGRKKQKQKKQKKTGRRRKKIFFARKKKENRCRHNCFLLLWLRHKMQIKRTLMLLAMFLM